MSKLRISLLGRPQFEVDGKQIQINRRKSIALLTYLAVTGEQHGRDKLAGLFWPHAPRDLARAALRRSLTAIRREVGSEWIVTTGEKVGLRLDGGLWLDVAQFDALLGRYEKLAADGDVAGREALDLLGEIAKLYRTGFLSELDLDSNTAFGEWQSFEAEGLRAKYASVLDRLVAGHATNGEYELAISYARRRVAVDPLQEPAHRSLMRLYAASGRAALAARQFRECARKLRDELGVQPDPETARLAEEIRLRHEVSATEPVAQRGMARAEAPVPAAGARAPEGRRRPSFPVLLGISAAGLVVVALGVVLAFTVLGDRPASLAVMPFEVTSAGETLSGLSAGMEDALVAELAKSPRLRVKPPLAVGAQVSGKSAGQTARELGVSYLVDGTCVQSGSSVRISVYLVDARKDAVIWADTYERAVTDAVSSLPQIAGAAAAGMQQRLGVSSASLR